MNGFLDYVRSKYENYTHGLNDRHGSLTIDILIVFPAVDSRTAVEDERGCPFLFSLSLVKIRLS